MDHREHDTTDSSHFGLSTALSDEMPPEYKYHTQGFVFEGTVKNLLIAFVVGLIAIFFMFVVLP